MDQIKEIGEIGIFKIEQTGITPIEAARSIVQTEWDWIDDESKKDLVTAGIASLLNGIMTQKRSQNPITSEERDENIRIDELHEQIRCPFPHKARKKRRECVGHLLHLHGKELKRAIQEQIKRNAEIEERLEEANSKACDRIAQCFQEVTVTIESYAQQRAVELLKSITLQSQDGSMQTLIDFGLDDLDKWERNSRAKSQGWKNRERWFRKTRSLLEQHGVCRIGDLPSDVMIEVSEGARKIWKKERVKVDA